MKKVAKEKIGVYKEPEVYHPVVIAKFEGKAIISYTPCNAKVGSFFISALRTVAEDWYLRPINLMGTGPHNESFAKITQAWTFQPPLDFDCLELFKKKVESLLNEAIANFLLEKK